MRLQPNLGMKLPYLLPKPRQHFKVPRPIFEGAGACDRLGSRVESDCQESHFRSTQHSFLQPGPPLFDYFVFAIDTWQVFFCTALFCIISNSSFTPTVYTDRDKSPHLCSRPFQYYGTIQAPQNVSCSAPCSSLSMAPTNTWPPNFGVL